MRLEISRRSDLAVRSIATLSMAGRPMKAAELATCLHSTTNFVPQVMAPLVRAGWVRSNPGPTGGYDVVIDVDELTVLDVIEAVDGPTDDGRCVVANSACDHTQPCTLHAAWARARSELLASLAATTLRDLAGSQGD